MQHDYNMAWAYIDALTQGNAATALIDFRMIHDTDKGAKAVPIRGTLAVCWEAVCKWNLAGYGAHITVNQMDGDGRKLANVQYIRAHVVDLDDLAIVQQAFAAVSAWYPAPSFYVQSSAGKYHVYWPAVPYTGNDRYQVIARKLVAKFNSDPGVIDAAHTLRLPGTFHLKNPSSPQLVKCAGMAGYGYVTSAETMEAALQDIQVSALGAGARTDLGDPEKTAPSWEWAKAVLWAIDPNDLDRLEWIKVTSSFKQSAWLHATEQDIFNEWSNWCAQYSKNDPGENAKQFNDIRNTQLGFDALVRRTPALAAQIRFKRAAPDPRHTLPAGAVSAYGVPATVTQPVTPASVPPMPETPQAVVPVEQYGEFIDEKEARNYFKNCTFVEHFGEMLTPGGRFLGPSAFNAKYGGKIFVISADGDTTDEPWKAATRSRLWTVPKVDHIRFVPMRKPGEHIIDDLGRYGVNTYKPAIIARRSGDVSPFLRHLELIIPDAGDRQGLIDVLRHNAQWPGFKIPWAYLIQSEEGAGKGVLKSVIKHIMGGPYVHFPNAQELIESGSKFNAWMRAKLFIVVDEIKVDERRDMIEVLKPMISEAEIEIQGKGHDQEKEDNYSNWIFFSNYKDAIPIRKNGRRFAIIYSAIQSVDDLLLRGMNQTYFDNLYRWLDVAGGKEIIADWLLSNPIECGSIPMRAPATTSTKEALHQSRGALETLILECVDDNIAGFRGGWASTTAVANMIKARGMKAMAPITISKALEGMGYQHIGRASRAYFSEDANTRAQLYNLDRRVNVAGYGAAQGYADK